MLERGLNAHVEDKSHGVGWGTVLRHWHGKAVVAEAQWRVSEQSKLKVSEISSIKSERAFHACFIFSLFLMQLGFVVIKCFCDLTALFIT